MLICIVVGLSEILIMVSDILSGGPTIVILNESNIRLLSKLATATKRNMKPKNLGVFLSEFILARKLVDF